MDENKSCIYRKKKHFNIYYNFYLHEITKMLLSETEKLTCFIQHQHYEKKAEKKQQQQNKKITKRFLCVPFVIHFSFYLYFRH
jgi:hypothetical protein